MSDRDALIAFYNATGGPSWEDSKNWLSDEPLDEWRGVTTDDDGRVVKLDLWRNGLSGEIPPELGRLSKLQNLYLILNDLSGPIPSELANLSKLEVLDLGGNELTGAIPPELANLANLAKLDLGYNELTGSFPQDLVKLQNLTYLDIGGMQVSGCLPEVWKGRFVLMEVSGDMVLDGSRLGGLPFCLHTSVPDLPEARDALTALYKATDGPNWKDDLNWLSDHPIGIWHGVTIGEGGLVVELKLPDNNLSGEIPLELTNLTDLFVLDLPRNDLHGEIPPELGRLTNLMHLDLSVNRLSGRIPPELGLLVRLNVLNLHVNDLSGEIPPDLGNLHLLETLSLWNNRLSGGIPSEFENLLGLETLDLGGNRLSGEVSPESGPDLTLWLERLAVIGIHRSEYGGNLLNGCVPGSLRDRLELSETALASLPFCDAGPTEEGLSQTGWDRDVLVALFLATGGRNWRESDSWLSTRPIGEWHGVTVDENGRVTRLELGDNDLHGQIPPQLGNLSNLQMLELWGNELNGGIPAELGNLSELHTLELGANELSGEIPPELGLLSVLKELDLYQNQLVGAIPPEFDNLLSLQRLILHRNQLNGEIPGELGNLDFLRSLSLGENRLTGKIPPELGNLVHLQVLSLHENRLDGELPTELSSLLNLTYLRLEGNRLTGCVPGHWQGQLDEYSDLGGLPFCDTTSVPQLAAPRSSDRYALVEFYYATDGRRWKNNSNWLSAEPLDQWYGVTTDEDGRVTELSLANNGVEGDLPPEISYLKKLEKLDLSQNPLRRGLPGTFGFLENLTKLTLRDTRLVGCVPDELEEQLDMSKSDLGGLSFCE